MELESRDQAKRVARELDYKKILSTEVKAVLGSDSQKYLLR